MNKKSAVIFISSALVWISPGLGSYEALAEGVRADNFTGHTRSGEFGSRMVPAGLIDVSREPADSEEILPSAQNSLAPEDFLPVENLRMTLEGSLGLQDSLTMPARVRVNDAGKEENSERQVAIDGLERVKTNVVDAADHGGSVTVYDGSEDAKEAVPMHGFIGTPFLRRVLGKRLSIKTDARIPTVPLTLSGRIERFSVGSYKAAASLASFAVISLMALLSLAGPAGAIALEGAPSGGSNDGPGVLMITLGIMGALIFGSALEHDSKFVSILPEQPKYFDRQDSRENYEGAVVAIGGLLFGIGLPVAFSSLSGFVLTVSSLIGGGLLGRTLGRYASRKRILGRLTIPKDALAYTLCWSALTVISAGLSWVLFSPLPDAAWAMAAIWAGFGALLGNGIVKIALNATNPRPSIRILDSVVRGIFILLGALLGAAAGGLLMPLALSTAAAVPAFAAAPILSILILLLAGLWLNPR